MHVLMNLALQDKVRVMYLMNPDLQDKMHVLYPWPTGQDKCTVPDLQDKVRVLNQRTSANVFLPQAAEMYQLNTSQVYKHHLMNLGLQDNVRVMFLMNPGIYNHKPLSYWTSHS